MTPILSTPSEAVRLASLQSLDVLDSMAETAYDDLVRLAAQTFGAPIALISLVDSERQWFKARVGLQVAQTPREHSFCAHAIERPNDVMVVGDATQDARFADNPLVTGEPHIRFYAGAPLVTSTGEAVGTLCVIDCQPRQIDAQRLAELQFLAREVMRRLEERAAAGTGAVQTAASPPQCDSARSSAAASSPNA